MQISNVIKTIGLHKEIETVDQYASSFYNNAVFSRSKNLFKKKNSGVDFVGFHDYEKNIQSYT